MTLALGPISFANTLSKGVFVFTDAAAKAYVARMTTQPSRQQKAIYDNFAVQAKAITSTTSPGVTAWSCIIDCGFLAAHTKQAAFLSFKSVVNPTLIGSGDVHIPGQGWSANGTAYLNTSYAFPSARQNDCSLGVYALSGGASDNPDMGNETAAIFCWQATTGNTLTRLNETTSRQTTVTSAVGFFFANRLASTAADSKVWKFGTAQTSTAGATTSAPVTPSILIGARNFGAITPSTRLLSYWHIGTGMPEDIIPAYMTLVEQTCAALAACETAFSTVTKETRSLYRTINRYSRKKEYLIGSFDNYNWPLPAVAPETVFTASIDAFTTVSGKVPAVKQWNYRHYTDVGQSAYDDFKAKLKAHYQAGGVIWLCHHAGNPVTGSFFQAPTSQASNTPGSMYDTSGNALANCLDGGSARSAFFDYTDAMSDFFKSMRADTGELIPIVFRPFHEAYDTWSWWSGGGGAGPTYAQVWRDFVDRLRSNGVTNVLLDFNRGLAVATAVYTSYFPGMSYVDLITGDFYEDTATLTDVAGFPNATTGFSSLCVVANAIFKPRFFPEMGGKYASLTKSGYWNTLIGSKHRDLFLNSAGFSCWRTPWGPKPGMTYASDFAAMVADPYCHTLDRLSGVYTDTVGA